MSDKFKTISVSLTELDNDLLNVRHPEKNSQIDVTHWMLEEHPKEILNLAEDIALHGLVPIEMPLVVKERGSSGYVIVEGNRRLTALKLLNNPHLAGDSSLVKKFQKLKTNASQPIPRKVQVVLAPSREEARWVIDRRHNGRDDGRGVVPWNTQQKARAERIRQGHAGRYERALNLIDFAETSNLLGDATQELKSSSFPITNLERLLADASFNQHLGISFSDDQTLMFDVNPEKAAIGIGRVLSDLINGLSVSMIKNTDLRKNYIKKIRNDLPSSDDILDKPVEAKPIRAAGKGQNGSTEKQRQRSKQDRRNSRYLIDSPIKISEKITNSVYLELRTCDLDSHALAATCLLRVLIDHSTTHYIEKSGITIATKGGRRPTLTQKVISTAEHLAANQMLKTDEIKKIRSACSSNGGISDPENLHLTLHSEKFIANKKDLHDIWDGTYEVLIRAIWSASL